MEPTTDLYRIIVVCLGNICRSPIAEVVLADRLDSAGLSDRATVESAGTGGWHIGSNADPRAQAAMTNAGYHHDHSARQFEPEWLTSADLVLGMDYANVEDLRALSPDGDANGVVRIFRSFDPTLMHLPEDDPALTVPDPYYGDSDGFTQVLEMIEHAADGIIDHVRLELGH